MIKLLIYHTGMCIKGPESWWIAKSITPQLVVNQSKINPQLHQLLGPLITPICTGKKLSDVLIYLSINPKYSIPLLGRFTLMIHQIYISRTLVEHQLYTDYLLTQHR